MHQSSYERMARFAERMKTLYAGRKVRVLDVGGRDVNGTYKDLFSFEGAEYVSLDIVRGPNVDVVVSDPYDWTELEDNSFDVIISGQTLEHVEWPWLTLRQIARKLKPRGRAYLIAPSQGPQHDCPLDCYRYLPAGMRALATSAGLLVLEVGRESEDAKFADGSESCRDCYCVLTKE